MGPSHDGAPLPLPLPTSSTTATTTTTTTIDPRLEFLAGTVAGVASLLTGQPFDTIKVRLQCQDRQHKTYQNAVHGLFKIVREEKVRQRGATGWSLSSWVGSFADLDAILPSGGSCAYALHQCILQPQHTHTNAIQSSFPCPLQQLGVAAINACVFSSYGLAQRLLPPLFQTSPPTTSPNLLIVLLSGSASGLVTSIVTTPIERLKILQQSAPTRGQEPSLIELVKKLGGGRGLYRGWFATCWRDLGYGPYFFIYEAVIRSGIGSGRGGGGGGERMGDVERGRVGEEEGREVGTTTVLLAGGMAGIAGWGSTVWTRIRFTMDVVKTRIQASEPYILDTETRKLQPHPYRTISSTIRNSYQAEGGKVFFVGLGPTLVRSVPVNMVCFFVFEAVVAAFR
ncbi:BQ2448_5001 [Microbotryum intermedium]|uniref:BQ2448_5001 protein n=1 Tax=Microbotryum intermedium TaxID=269621 RepID=A0A238EZU4_9BASI|nr:BQ2448_5001 [Microbotryum intermedium]